MNKLFGILSVFLLVLPLASASYINETIVLDNEGTAYISGTTDLDILSILDLEDETIKGYTQELTSKKGLLWTFRYTAEKPSDYLITVALPEFAEVHEVVSEAKTTFSVKENREVIKFEAKENPLDIKINYVIASSEKFQDNTIVILIVFIIILAGIVFKYKPKKADAKNEKGVLNQEKLNTVKLTLNENQLKILEALIASNGEASQNKLNHLTGIPKSSLSRNLELMAQRSIVSKFFNGTTNHIKVHPSLYQQ